VQVLFAIACGVLLGMYYPTDAVAMKPLGDGFIKLIKMVIAPVIFCTVVSGIAGMQDVKKIGRVGGKPCSISKWSPPSRSSSACSWPI
jgi:aerobic C4-dicarboxylate transport protein